MPAFNLPIRDQGWGPSDSRVVPNYGAYPGAATAAPNQAAFAPQQQQSYGSSGGYGGGGGMYGMADALMGNQLGSFLNFGNQMQNALGQMGMFNLANQQAKLYNNNLNSQLGQTQMNSNAVIQAALANALGNVGSAYQGRMGISDQLSNPVYQEYLRGNSGVNVANAQNQGALDRMKLLPGILSGLGGMFNLGGNGASGGGLLGFSNANSGQSAQMGGSATQGAVQAGKPLPQQAEQQATSSASINPMLARMSGRAPVAQSRDYLRQYMGMA